MAAPIPSADMGSVCGKVHLLLRLEGLCMLAAALAFYARQGFDWGVFVRFFLVPDLSMLAYLGGARHAGAACAALRRIDLGRAHRLRSRTGVWAEVRR